MRQVLGGLFMTPRERLEQALDERTLNEALECLIDGYADGHERARAVLLAALGSTEEPRDCAECDGRGEVQEGTGTASSEGGEDWRVAPCSACGGTGKAAPAPPTSERPTTHERSASYESRAHNLARIQGTAMCSNCRFGAVRTVDDDGKAARYCSNPHIAYRFDTQGLGAQTHFLEEFACTLHEPTPPPEDARA
jgi:hypothetical protein